MARRRSALRRPPAPPIGRRSAVVKSLVLVIGALYTLVGVTFAFAAAPGLSAEPTGERVLGMEVVPLLTLVHILVGALASAVSRVLLTARVFGWLLLTGYAAAFSVASVTEGLTWASFDWVGNWLRVVTAALAVVVVLLPVRRATEVPGPRRPGVAGPPRTGHDGQHGDVEQPGYVKGVHDRHRPALVGRAGRSDRLGGDPGRLLGGRRRR